MRSNDRAPVLPEPFYKLAETAKLDNDPAVMQALRGALLSRSPTALRAMTEHLRFKATEELARQKPFYVPRKEELFSFPDTDRLIGFGFVQDADFPFVMPVDLLNQHMGVWGGTGTGKTNFLHLTALQTIPHAVVWIFDYQKSDYRSLAGVVPELLVLDARDDLAWNPLEVRHPVGTAETITTFIAVFAKSFGLLVGSQALLQNALHDLFANGEQVTLRDLRRAVASINTRGHYRARQYQDSVLNRLDGMLMEAPGTYAYTNGFPITDLAQRNVVFELKGLNEHHARFLVMHLLYTLFLHRMRSGERGNWLRNLVLVDEAAWLAPPAGNVDTTGWSPLAEILRMGREAGLGLCLASQTANLDAAVFENTRTRSVLRLGDGKDIERVEKALSLDKDQGRYVTRLGTGECIVGIPQVRPFLLNVPEVPL